MNRAGQMSFLCLGLAIAVLTLLQGDSEVVVIQDGQAVGERVMELPEDGGQWSSINCYEDGAKSAESRELASWFATTPRLQSLTAQTRHFDWPASHWWIRKYQATTAVPFTLLLNEKSQRVYLASRGKLPGDGEALADEIQAQIADCCPDVNPPQPKEPWLPQTKIPNLGPGGPGEDGGLFVVLALLAASGGFGFYAGRQRQPTAA